MAAGVKPNTLRAVFVRWYMGRVAGRYCPCEWPVRSRRLMHLCGRIDDAQEALNFYDFAAFYHPTTGTLSSTQNVVVTSWRRLRHNESGRDK